MSEGSTLTGVFVISSDPRLVELWALGGFDFVVVDLEHSTLDLQDADRLIVHALAAGLTPLVRVARGDERLAQRALDAGAAGIVAAGVECRKDLDMWWSAIMYPPAGQRGVAQVRANGWGAGELGDPSDRCLFVPMIESVRAIDAVDELFSFPHSDWWHLGLVDLAADLRASPGAPERDRLVSRVGAAAARRGIRLGCNSGSGVAPVAGAQCVGVNDRQLILIGARAWASGHPGC